MSSNPLVTPPAVGPPVAPGQIVRCLGCAPGIVVKTHSCAGARELAPPVGGTCGCTEPGCGPNGKSTQRRASAR